MSLESANEDYITNLREKLRAACQKADLPDATANFRIADAERAGGTPSKQRPGPNIIRSDAADESAGCRSMSPEGAEVDVETIANDVLRLRSFKRQHDETRQNLVNSEIRLQKLTASNLSQLHLYLEKNLSDPMLAVQVQDVIFKIIESLCAACRIELANISPDAVLAASRRLFRDIHSFTSKLCKLSPLSDEDAKRLAPCLLYASNYKKVRERDVNTCCETLLEWVSSFYLYCNIADQIELTAEQLEIQEKLLNDRGGSKLLPAPTGLGVPGSAAKPARPRTNAMRGSSSATAFGSSSQFRRQSSSPVASTRNGGTQRHTRSAAPGSPKASRASAPTCQNSGVVRRTTGPPDAFAPLGGRSGPPGSLTGGVVRRTSGPPELHGNARAGPPTAPGVQRMQSDKTLTSVLRSIKQARAQSPGAPSALTSGPGPVPTPQRGVRLPPGALATVPERRMSMPGSWGHDVSRSPTTGGTKDCGVSVKPAPVTSVVRSVTAVPRF